MISLTLSLEQVLETALARERQEHQEMEEKVSERDKRLAELMAEKLRLHDIMEEDRMNQEVGQNQPALRNDVQL